MKRFAFCLALVIVAVALVVAVSVAAEDNENDQQQQQQQQQEKLSLSDCRELGFAAPAGGAGSASLVAPVCGTCDVLAELLKASPEEKASQTPEQRQQTKTSKRQLVADCRRCCVPGHFNDDDGASGGDAAAGGVVAQQQRLLQQQAAGASGGAQALPGSFVSAVLEVDKALAQNTAHEINKFIRTYSGSWDSSKISVEYKDTVAPRLHLKRLNSDKVEVMNVGNWESELIWSFLQRHLAS